MTSQLRCASSPCGVGRVSALLLGLLVSATVIGRSALAAEADHEPAAAQQQPSVEANQPENQESKSSAGPAPGAPPAPRNICEALAMAATANELPVDFFTRLIWQESRFAPDAISRKGAQGIAQFMPGTARLSGLENPFDPFEAIGKSGQLLRELRREFGNLGLAAAAYNAGPGRVHDWLGGRRLLPRETQAYVQIVTGHSAEEWAAKDQTLAARMPSTEAIKCDVSVTASMKLNGAAGAAKPEAAKPETVKPETVKPWGVEIVGGTTPETALARYRDWRPKYETLVAGREPHVVIRGVLGQAGAARVRLGEDSRADAQKLCALLRAAGAYCDVMRN
jgi:Transglycosylase SLT domain